MQRGKLVTMLFLALTAGLAFGCSSGASVSAPSGASSANARRVERMFRSDSAAPIVAGDELAHALTRARLGHQEPQRAFALTDLSDRDE